jgi:DNA-binding transcriptional ArsR family regulator
VDYIENIFKNVNMKRLRSRMSVTVTQDRLRRLVDSGLRGVCRPTERISELRRRAKEADVLTITRLEQMFFGLADKTRLMILGLLTREELCECEVTSALGLTQPTASHHLNILERSGLVSTRREGKWVFYSVVPTTKVLLAKGSALVKGAA